MSTQKAIAYVAKAGVDTYLRALDGVLYTEKQIGFMADRILWTEGLIGDMADRIIYVVELSQSNVILGMYMLLSLSFLGLDESMNNMAKYSVTVQPVSYIPWLST